MTLQQKILAALAKSTSRTPMSTDAVQAAVGVKRATLTALEGLRDALKVGHCRVIKGGETADLWWLAGNVESKMLPQTAAANRKTVAAKARAARNV